MKSILFQNPIYYFKLIILYLIVYATTIFTFLQLGLNPYISVLMGIIVSFFVYDTSNKSLNLTSTRTNIDENIIEQDLFLPQIKIYESNNNIKLEHLIGLENVKKNINNIFNLIKVEEKRGNKPIIGHYIFQGNPGTGKTTVGRILGKKFKDMNFLPNGHFIEVTREDLIGQYQGHTAFKTTKILESAIGGVLFIDEVYSLVTDAHDSFGMEAINTIVPFMENNRDKFILIIAGYTEPLEKFLNTNSGLKSRFDYTIDFEDYTATQLYKIFFTFAKDYYWDAKTDIRLKKLFKTISRYKNKNFGNGREVRKIFEQIKQNQSNRLVNSINFLSKRDSMLFHIQESDIMDVRI